MKKIKRAKILLRIAITIMVLNFVFCCLMTRIINIDCFYCKRRIYTLSAIEYFSGPWKDIPCFHPMCQDYVCNFLAPNCGLSIGRWLEIRGYEPRAEEIEEKTWEEIINDELVEGN
jgi:hypothetical protein